MCWPGTPNLTIHWYVLLDVLVPSHGGVWNKQSHEGQVDYEIMDFWSIFN